MSWRVGRSTLASCLLSVGLMALGGCPLEAPLVDDVEPGAEPGTYYVEQVEGKLYYYELAEVRGAENRWIELSEEGEWYVGPGVYRLREDHTWSRDADAEGLTLDEIIQLHDAPPPVPEGAV